MTSTTNILVLGGNGFIGGEAVARILDQGMAVTVLNRGRSWDWDKTDTIKPRVRQIVWDRKKPLAECQELQSLMTNTSFDSVVDFSGYYGYMVQDCIEFMKSKTKLYVYVSSDSVYEVCEKHHTRPTAEDDDVRPQCKEKRKRLKREDSYGHEKLKGEEVLRHQGDDGVDYVILRLADVIGPRDTTDRWWQLQNLVELAAAEQVPVFIPEHLRNTRISLVYVKDVASVITDLVAGKTVNVLNQAYNLACEETPTLEELMEHIKNKLGIRENIKFVYSDSDYISSIYPSVEKGVINIDKAGRDFGWSPTPLDQVCRETVSFYQNVVNTKTFYSERKDIYRTVKDDWKSFYNNNSFRTLKKLLALSDK